VQGCFNLAEKVTRAFDIPFLIMTYFNIPYKCGTMRFAEKMAKRNLRGAIVPDLPPEEGKGYLKAMQKFHLAPILIFTPTTSVERMKYLDSFGRGFIYCIARKGVTGSMTTFSGEMDLYLSQCRMATSLPLALGFGIKEKADIDFLKGKAEIAVIGTQTIRIMEEEGIASVGDFIRNLR
jgi:tryptophan synthase alpha chain